MQGDLSASRSAVVSSERRRRGGSSSSESGRRSGMSSSVSEVFGWRGKVRYRKYG